jgi:hypothetical protein
MSITFAQPAWGWLAALLALAAALAAARMRRSWRWRITALLLPLCAAACVAAALSRPLLTQSRDERIVLLLDLSASTRTSPWRDPQWVRALVEKRLGPRRPVTIVGFARRPRLLAQEITANDASAWPPRWDPDGGGSDGRPGGAGAKTEAAEEDVPVSDLRAALAWRAGDDDHAPRWIVTDGLLDPPPAVPFPTAWTIVPPAAVDAGITDVAVRPAGEGLELLARVRITGNPQSPAASESTSPRALHYLLEVRRDGELLASSPVSFSIPPPPLLLPAAGGASSAVSVVDSARWITLADPRAAPSEVHHYALTVRGSGAGPSADLDPWPENNSASISWVPGSRDPVSTRPSEERRVLVLTASPSAESPFQGLPDARIVSVGSFQQKAWQLAADGWQAIALDDVPLQSPFTADPRPSLTPGQVKTLERFVRDTGGGLLIAGRRNSFASGHYAEAGPEGATGGLEGLSPVWSRPHEGGGGLQVVFLLDASGSMNEAVALQPETRGAAVQERGTADGTRFRLLAQNVQQAAALLAADDRLAIITFNGGADRLADGTAASVRPMLAAALGGVMPTGTTAPDAALGELRAVLAEPPGTSPSSRLVILVTDGEIPAMAIDRWEALLAAQVGVRLVIIAPPPAPGSLVQRLVQAVPGAALYPAAAPGAWEGLLRRIVSREVDGGAHDTPLPWQAAVDWLQPRGGEASRWMDVWIKPESTLLVRGDPTPATGTRPLAALVQRGLGQVAAIAMSGKDDRALLDQLLTRVAAAPGDRRFAVMLRKGPSSAAPPGDDTGGSGWRLIADGADANGFIDGERLAANLFLPDRPEPVRITMRQTAPGHYEAAAEGAVAATVFREASSPVLLGRVPIPSVETGEWPASFSQGLQVADNSLALPAEGEGRWNPAPTGSLPLATALQVLAVGCALAALLLRR